MLRLLFVRLIGVLHDEQCSFGCPYEDDRPPWTDAAVIGALGLTLAAAKRLSNMGREI